MNTAPLHLLSTKLQIARVTIWSNEYLLFTYVADFCLPEQHSLTYCIHKNDFFSHPAGAYRSLNLAGKYAIHCNLLQRDKDVHITPLRADRSSSGLCTNGISIEFLFVFLSRNSIGFLIIPRLPLTETGLGQAPKFDLHVNLVDTWMITRLVISCTEALSSKNTSPN